MADFISKRMKRFILWNTSDHATHLLENHWNKTVEFLRGRNKRITSTFLGNDRSNLIVSIGKLIYDMRDELEEWLDDVEDPDAMFLYGNLPEGVKGIALVERKAGKTVEDCAEYVIVIGKKVLETGLWVPYLMTAFPIPEGCNVEGY